SGEAGDQAIGVAEGGAEGAGEEGGRGDAVDVVVAEDGDAFAPVDGADDAIDGGVHVGKGGGVGSGTRTGSEEVGGGGGVPNVAAIKEVGDERVGVERRQVWRERAGFDPDGASNRAPLGGRCLNVHHDADGSMGVRFGRI